MLARYWRPIGAVKRTKIVSSVMAVASAAFAAPLPACAEAYASAGIAQQLSPHDPAPDPIAYGDPDVMAGQLIMSLTRWLAEAYDLPRIDQLPAIEFLPPDKLIEVRKEALARWPRAYQPEPIELVAIYRDDVQTIYLPEHWRGRSPSEVSILVHELVHHLQNAGELKYPCAQSREKLAYQAQEDWLAIFGDDLQNAFGINALTLLMRTNCAF